MVSPFKYSGRKVKYVDKINGLYKNLFFSLDTSDLIYVEPYAGSASVFFNLVSDFKTYIISDIDRNVIRIHRSLQEAQYSKYLSIIESVKSEFGDIRESKDAYYSFREWFNQNHWQKETTEEGLYLQLLFGSCINSMARFGKNGFNQGFGNRLYLLSEEEYGLIHKRLQRAQLYCLDFETLKATVLSKFSETDLFLFLDPPYISRATSYRTLEADEHQAFLKYLNETKSKWIYTDIYENQIPHKYFILRNEMSNTSPLSKKEKLSNTEVAFYNF